MVWSDMNHGPPSVALTWVRSKGSDSQDAFVVLPSGWGTGPSDSQGFGSFGKDLEIDPHGMFAIFNVQRRYHFAQLVEPLQLPGAQPMACAQVFQDTDYAYLRVSYCRLGIYEASHDPLQQDKHGDWVCNIMTHGNVLLNHPDHLALASSLSRDGCVVKSVLGEQRLVDWLPLLQGDCDSQNWQAVFERARPHWAALQADSEGKRPVQHPQSLLWGWASNTGRAVIEPRFSKVGQFYRGLATAAEPADVQQQGLVNKAGIWMLPTQWLSISWDSPRLIVVQNAQNEWGAVGFSLDERGQAAGQATVVVPLQSEQPWLTAISTLNSDRNIRWTSPVFVNIFQIPVTGQGNCRQPRDCQQLAQSTSSLISKVAKLRMGHHQEFEDKWSIVSRTIDQSCRNTHSAPDTTTGGRIGPESTIVFPFPEATTM